MLIGAGFDERGVSVSGELMGGLGEVEGGFFCLRKCVRIQHHCPVENLDKVSALLWCLL